MTQPSAKPSPATQFERWQDEQAKWQETVQAYIDTAAKDPEFLTHMGNAMRGSLLAGKPYPGSAPAPKAPTPEEVTRDTVEELLFAVRRLEGQIKELSFEMQALPQRISALTLAGPDPESVEPAARGHIPAEQHADDRDADAHG